jgi:YndJ-like protein
MNTGSFPPLIGHLTLVDLLLLLAPVVIVPLGLRLVPLSGRLSTRMLWLARCLQPVGALAAVAAFLLSPGWPAGFVALGWLAVCGIASLAGLTELLETRSLRPLQIVPAAALGYLSIGAAWLVISRAGLRPLGFDAAIIELTSVHFHYAGFAASLMAGLSLTMLRQRTLTTRRLGSTGALLVVAGTPITAAAITTRSPVLTILGPLVLAGGIFMMATLNWAVVVPMVGSSTARWLLRVSAASVALPMLLGVDYAVSRIYAIPALDLRGMAAIHGDLNALAFTLVGLLGWTLVPARGNSARPANAGLSDY